MTHLDHCLSWLVVVLMAPGCATMSNQNASSEPPEAPLEAHVAALRAESMPELKIGRLPPDLSVPEFSRTFEARASAVITGNFGAERTALELTGVAGDRMCFTYMRVLDAGDDTAGPKLLDDERGEGTWIAFVDSLTALTGPAWPAGPTASVLDAVELGDDAVHTTHQDRDIGNGESIKVSKDSRFVGFKLCGAKPAQPTTSRYLVAVSHRLKPSARDEKWSENNAPILGASYRAAFARKNSALVVWALTADGKFDLKD